MGLIGLKFQALGNDVEPSNGIGARGGSVEIDHDGGFVDMTEQLKNFTVLRMQVQDNDADTKYFYLDLINSTFHAGRTIRFLVNIAGNEAAILQNHFASEIVGRRFLTIDAFTN